MTQTQCAAALGALTGVEILCFLATPPLLTWGCLRVVTYWFLGTLTE